MNGHRMAIEWRWFFHASALFFAFRDSTASNVGNRAANCATGFCSTCKSERFAWSAMLEESGEGPRLLYFRFLGQGMPRRRGIEQRGRTHSAMGPGSLGNGAGLARQWGLGSFGQWDLLGQWAHSAMRLGLTRRMGLARQWGLGSLGNRTYSANGPLGRMGLTWQ